MITKEQHLGYFFDLKKLFYEDKDASSSNEAGQGV